MKQYAIQPFRKLLKSPIRQELPPEAEVLRTKLRHCERLVERKVPWDEITVVTGITRAKYYRITSKVRLFGIAGFIALSKRPKQVRVSKVPQAVRDLVLRLRKENPTYGKAKIVRLMTRDHGISFSESTIGRILTKLLAERKIARSISAARPKRKRHFKGGHAQRWQYGMIGTEPGAMVEIDQMTVRKNGISFKHFQAWDPVTKVVIASTASDATSASAAKFLRKVIAELPFALKSIQTDGGSEFMKHFEAECQKLNIPLYILPPKQPQYNGGVERGNRIFREEFYARADLLADSVGAINAELQKAVLKYNSYRPHFSLKGMTPYEYNAALSQVAA